MPIKCENQIRKVLFKLTFWVMVAVFCFGVNSPSVAQAAEIKTPVSGRYFSVSQVTSPSGATIDKNIINGPSTPPPGFDIQRQSVSAPSLDATAGIQMLTTPAYKWVFGCSSVSAAMIAGYYDRTGFPNIYTGATNGGVMPLDDAIWPTWTDSASATYPSNPLIASRIGTDGRLIRGSIEDYWVADPPHPITDPDYVPVPDPYITNSWTQHTWGDAIGDYMKTSQIAFGNDDGATKFYTWKSQPSPYSCNDMVLFGNSSDDGTYGRKLFYESKGYTVTDCYNQRTDNNIAYGFSFADFKAEINVGRPVMLNLEGHTVVGIGYDDSSNQVYLHDTWDYVTHTMTWGGSYSGMALHSVSIVKLEVRSERIIRVTPVGSTTWPCGDTWGNSCELQTALTSADYGNELWVAKGVYKPTTDPTDQTSSIWLSAGVALYGGFAGTETARTQRDPLTNVTIFSGDIDSNDSQSPVITDAYTVTGNTTNSYHVVAGMANDVTLDGVTITGGYGYYGCPYGWNSQYGGGIYNQGSMTINNVVFSGNQSFDGGGIYITSPLTLTNSTFIGNYASGSGGGISHGWSSTVRNTNFVNNRALYDGAGMKSVGGNNIIENLTFTDNWSGTNAGGLFVRGTATVADVTFTHNHAGNLGGGMAIEGTDLVTLTRGRTAHASPATNGAFHGRRQPTAIWEHLKHFLQKSYPATPAWRERSCATRIG